MKSEIIYGLPFVDYQAIDALNLSLLKELDDSPGRLDWRSRNPWKPTDPAILGNAIHTLLLEPGEFAARYITPPVLLDELPSQFIEVPGECLGAAGQLLKAGREWVAQLAPGQVPVKSGDWGAGGLSTRSSAFKAWRLWAEAQGREVLTHATNQQALNASEAVRGYGPAMDLIAAARHEVSLVWQDKDTGLWCKGRMDNWDASGRVETDLKTTGKSVHYAAIGRTAYLAGWHIQRAFYCMGIEAITGEPLRGQNVIAVEVDEPWRCEVYRFGLAELELGRAKASELLAKYSHCKIRSEWPMNAGQILPMTFPKWAF